MDIKAIYDIGDKAKKYDEMVIINNNRGAECSFCGKRQEEVVKMIAANNMATKCERCTVFICNECIEECFEALKKQDEIQEQGNA